METALFESRDRKPWMRKFILITVLILLVYHFMGPVSSGIALCC